MRPSHSRSPHHSGKFPPTLKRLGQHFLTDESVLHRIVDALEVTANDTVVEIGPGRGALTDLLAERAGRLVAVELDHALADLLRKRYARRSNVEIVEADILETSLEQIAGSDFLLAGNVPYYITTPILFHTLAPPNNGSVPRRAVYLVQHEVAERAVAGPGGKIYGALSVNLQVSTAVEYVFSVPPDAFRPPPAVDSAVMRVTPLAQPLIAIDERTQFQVFVQSIFGLRRKQMIRVLRTIFALDAEQATTILQELNIDPAARPEVLPTQDFARLFRATRECVR